MTIDQSTLTKGQVRKLNALRKSVGDDIAENAFGIYKRVSASMRNISISEMLVI